MNESAWKRLLNLIRDGNVVPVVGQEIPRAKQAIH